jgi:hypothetical protein
MARNRNSLIQEYCQDVAIDTQNGVQPAVPAQEMQFSISVEQQYSTEELYVIQEQINPDIKDPLRSVTGYYWTYVGNEDEIEFQDLVLLKSSIPFVKTSQYSVTDETEYSIKQKITFDQKIIEKSLRRFSIKFDEEKFDEKLLEIKESLQNSSNDFTYVVFGNDRPIKRTIESSITDPFSISTKNNYNFFNKSYENKGNFYPTTGLPNYYLLSEDYEYRSKWGGPEYKNQDLANYNGLIETSLVSYIQDFSEKQIPADTTNLVSVKMNNVLFPHEKMSTYEERQENVENIFPFSLQLEFDTEPVGRISRSLKDAEINDYLLSYIRRLEDNEELQNTVFSIKGNTSPLNKRVEIDTLLLSDSFFASLLDQSEFDDLEDSNICYLDNIEVDNFDLTHFYDEQELLKTEKTLSFNKMLNGDVCYSETLYYKVDKYEVSGDNYQKIQTLYLTNVDDVSKVKILDTQVKYGKKYRYEVYSYKYVLGNKYSYESIERINDEYNVRIIPTPYLIKVAYASIEEVILDKPPVPPEVEVVPYKDNAEEISFFFNPSSVEYEMQEYAFSEEERVQYSLVRDSQNLNEDELITFGGDDKVEKYYIYRIEKHPTSYEDFKNSLYRIVQTEENCSSAEYLDNLEPNKKYYYIFRSVDVHGHISPPTEVHQIEIINEGGTVFVQVQLVPFRELAFQKEEKSFKKYIHIKPTLVQSLIDETSIERPVGEGSAMQETASDKIRRVVLGNRELLEESVWDKRFKMRIKSKSTNKFVDIKFVFKTKKDENNA